MSILNYNGLVFAEHKGENFHVLSMNFIDSNGEFREITLHWSPLGRKSYWVAQLSGRTTEYVGNLTEVLDKVVEHFHNG